MNARSHECCAHRCRATGTKYLPPRTVLKRWKVFSQNAPDLVITDLSMPNMDGVELTKAIRALGDTPIIVLSVRDQDAAKILALDSGADDYVTPSRFSTPELLARVRVQLRRRVDEESLPATLSEGDFSIDIEAHRVLVRGEELHLTPKEFDLLVLFLRNSGRVLNHKTLLKSNLGPSWREPAGVPARADCPTAQEDRSSRGVQATLRASRGSATGSVQRASNFYHPLNSPLCGLNVDPTDFQRFQRVYWKS